KARQERAKNRRLDQTGAGRIGERYISGPCDLQQTGSALRTSVANFEGIKMLAVRSPQEHVDGRKLRQTLQIQTIATNRQIHRFGKWVAQVARQKCIFKVIDAASRLTEQHDAWFV